MTRCASVNLDVRPGFEPLVSQSHHNLRLRLERGLAQVSSRAHYGDEPVACASGGLPHPFVATLLPTRTLIGQSNRLAGECRGLTVVGGVVGKAVASLPGDDVDHGALNIAEFGGRACGLKLKFLNEVDARLRPGLAAARTREVGAIDQKHVLIRARAEYGNAVARNAAGSSG
jgi:hypothetical protein